MGYKIERARRRSIIKISAQDTEARMKKTLILAVDRDDDFGAKGGVQSPVIGVEACEKAAGALGSADPEDSDTNALYAAINLYRQMERDGERPAGSFEIALVCGDQKVGYKSDEALSAQLEQVIDEVKPDGAILVSDGAEDEYIYPIISSRVPIDSVRKVYVKQAPGVEGTFYIIQKTLTDPQKRQRFMAPIAWIIIAISAVYMLVNVFKTDGFTDYIMMTTTPLLFFVIGLVLLFYSYSLDIRLSNAIKRANKGALDLIFLIAGVAIMAVGLAYGYISISDYYTTRFTQRAYIFLSNALWPCIFGLMLFRIGTLLDEYFSTGKLKIEYTARFLDLVAFGLILCGVFDLVGDSVDIVDIKMSLIFLEIVGGLTAAIIGTLMQLAARRKLKVSEDGAA